MGVVESNGKANLSPDMKRYGTFSKGMIEKLKEKLELITDDFGIDKEQLKAFFRCSDKEADTIFKLFDMDQNGRIDSYEFICGMAMLSQSTLEEKVELIFNLYDFDGNKFITRDELVIMMANSLASLKYMAKEPPPSLEDIEKKTDEVMKSADVNNDKKVSLKEFISYVTKNKEVLQMLNYYGVITKDDLRPDFGGGEEETGDIPECDSDLENETNPERIDRDDRTMKIKSGVEFNQTEDTASGPFESEEVKQGTEFMAVKPWLGVVKHSVPTGYKPFEGESNPPEATLELEYIHGYRCEDMRNNLRYTNNGNIVYNTAAVGVVLDGIETKQKHFIEHNDDIISLAIHPNLQIVATGEIGPNPLICVWDSTTMECLARITGPLKKGISHLAFSQNGNLLAASGADDYHCIAVYDWEKAKSTEGNAKKRGGVVPGLIATGQGTRANILQLIFDPSDEVVAACAVKEVDFITFHGGVIKVQKGIGWGSNRQQAVLCGAYMGTSFVTGAFGGQLFIWKGRNLSGTINAAHKGCVNCIFARQGNKGVITGGNDGIVCIWDTSLKKLSEINLITSKGLNSVMPKLRSVCEGEDGSLLLGTRGGEIIEFKGEKPKVLMRSHFRDELWGLAIHPKKSEFATLGQDCIFAIWDIVNRKQKQFAKIDCSGDVIAYSPDGAYLALGLASGQLIILDAEKYTTTATRKDRSASISEIKFAPDCSTMCVGASDSLIFVYDITAKFKLIKKMRSHHSRITHLDYSESSGAIQSISTSYEILYHDIGTGKQLPGGATAFKDEKWATWTSVLGWPVQGIWPPCSDGSDINSCDRSVDRCVLATGDDFSKVKLFKFPCPIEKSSFQMYRGHSSHVTNVRFSQDGNYLISIGGHDKSIFQWRYNQDKAAKEEMESLPAELDVEIDEESEIVDKEEKKQPKKEQKKEGNGLFATEEIDKADEFMAVKPWLGEVAHSIPTGYKEPRNAGTIPDANLNIRYAHGYRSFDTRNNVKWTKSGKVLYHTAALGVVLDPDKNEQTYFIQHEEDIVSLAIHPSGTIAATGQMAAAGKARIIEIYVWNVDTKEVLSCLKGFHRRAIRHLRFSPSGKYLLSIGEDDYHSLAIYDWAAGKMLCNSKVDGHPVTTCEYKTDSEFVTLGTRHVKFFTHNGTNVTANSGLMGRNSFEVCACAAFAFSSKSCVTGSVKGNLIIWSGRSAGKRIPAHKGQIWALLAKGNALISGGQDGLMIIWDQNFKQASTIDLNKSSKINPGIRAIDVNSLGAYIVGTKGAEIIRIHQGKSSALMRGHFTGETWGLCVAPNGAKFASCGGDKTLRVWTVDKMVMIMVFSDDGRAIDWASNGNYIVYATINGHIYALNPNEKLRIMSEVQSSFVKDQWIEDIKISPNNQMVAFGAHRGVSKVEVMKIEENGSGLAKMYLINAGITSALTHLDWDVTSSTLVINSQAYELKFVNVLGQSVMSASSSKDIDWHTWTCTLGFPVQGIFPPFSDGSDINTTCRSNGKTVIATGDDFSKVKLFKYPCVVKNAAFKQYQGHSSHLTKVKFSFDDRYLVSVGGNDKTVIIWNTDMAAEEEVKEEAPEEQEANEEDTEAYNETNLEEVNKKIEQLEKKEKTSTGGFAEETVEEGTEFMATRAWLGALKEPTGFLKPPFNQSQPPKVNLQLEHVYGYRSHDCKNNIGFIQDGRLVYHAAAVGIVLDQNSNTQNFFIKHTDDILSIAFHPDGVRIATGEIGPRPFIYIWDSSTCQIVSKFRGHLHKGVRSLSFSPSGDYLAGIDMNTDHMLAIYDVGNSILLALTKTDPSLVLQVSFKSETELVTIGVKHYMFWTVNNKNLSSKRGIFGSRNNIIGALATDKDLILTGNVAGEIYQWNGNTVTLTKKLHTRPVDCIKIYPEFVLTGGRDAKINVVDRKLASLMIVDVGSKMFNSIHPGVRSLTMDAAKSSLIIGTLGSEIFEMQIDVMGKKAGENRILMQGHYAPCTKWTNEIWGLAPMKEPGKFVTVSDDATLRVWDVEERKQERLVRFDIDEIGNALPKDPKTGELADNVKARSVEISPDSSSMAVGFKDGSLAIVNTSTWKVISKRKDAKSWVSDIKFSPDGTSLAVGSHDTIIYLYKFPEMTKRAICKGHSSFIRHIDWSEDSSALHSNSGDYELLFWDGNTGKQHTGGATAYRDEKWNTWTCIIGWPVQGIWLPGSKGSDINGCARSNVKHDNYELLATADDFSTVRVFRYPCIQKNSMSLDGRGHSSHVTNVRFSPDDKYLFSTGGNDGCVFQWLVQ